MKREVKFKNLLAYGIGDLYGGGSFFIISTLFLFFLTEVAGLHPVQAGIIIFVGKIWDAISDPLMGYISDHMVSRWGRRRLFFLIGMAPVGISFALLWLPLQLPGNLSFIWYLFAYVFFSTVFTMMMVPYSALSAEMTTDYKARNRLSGARMIFSQISALIAGVVPKLIIDSFPAGQGYIVMGTVFGLFYALPWLFVYRGTWELPYQTPEKESFAVFYRRFLSILGNRSFRIHIGMYICSYSAMDILMALFIYYLSCYLNLDHLYSAFLGALVLTQILCLPLYVKICNRIGQARAYMIGLGLWGAGMLALFTITPDTSAAMIFPIIILTGAGLSAGVMVPWAMLPPVTDVDELITTQRRAGIYSGMMTLIRKSVQGVILFAVGISLSRIGFVSGASSQTAETVKSLRLLFVFAPLVFLVLGQILAWRFKVTPHTHKVMLEEIARLKGGGDRAAVKPETKEICEEITGQKYENLYRA
jgi:oligogalacturonide transporter